MGSEMCIRDRGMISGRSPWRDISDAEREDERERLRVLHDGTPFHRMLNREKYLAGQQEGTVRGDNKFA